MSPWHELAAAQLRAQTEATRSWLEASAAGMEAWSRCVESLLKAASGMAPGALPLDGEHRHPWLALLPPRGASFVDFYGRRANDVDPERL